MPTPTPIQATGSNNQDDWQDISEDEWQDIPQKQKIGVLESIWQGIGKGGLSFMEGLGGLGEMVGIENQLDDTARQAINRANQMYEPSGFLAETAGTVFEGVTNLAPLAIPGIGTVGLFGTLGGKNMGQSYSDLKSRGSSDGKALAGSVLSSAGNTVLDAASMYPATLPMKYGKRVVLSAGADTLAAIVSTPMDYFIEQDVAEVNPFEGRSMFDEGKRRVKQSIIQGTVMPTTLDVVKVGTGKTIDFTTRKMKQRKSQLVEKEIADSIPDILKEQSQQEIEWPKESVQSTVMQKEMEVEGGTGYEVPTAQKVFTDQAKQKNVSEFVDNLQSGASIENLVEIDPNQYKQAISDMYDVTLVKDLDSVEKDIRTYKLAESIKLEESQKQELSSRIESLENQKTDLLNRISQMASERDVTFENVGEVTSQKTVPQSKKNRIGELATGKINPRTEPLDLQTTTAETGWREKSFGVEKGNKENETTRVSEPKGVVNKWKINEVTNQDPLILDLVKTENSLGKGTNVNKDAPVKKGKLLTQDMVDVLLEAGESIKVDGEDITQYRSGQGELAFRATNKQIVPDNDFTKKFLNAFGRKRLDDRLFNSLVEGTTAPIKLDGVDVRTPSSVSEIKTRADVDSEAGRLNEELANIDAEIENLTKSINSKQKGLGQTESQIQAREANINFLKSTLEQTEAATPKSVNKIVKDLEGELAGKERNFVQRTFDKVADKLAIPRTIFEKLPETLRFHDTLNMREKAATLNQADLTDASKDYFNLPDKTRVDAAMAVIRESNKSGQKIIPTDGALSKMGLDQAEIKALRSWYKTADLALEIMKDAEISHIINTIDIPDARGLKGTPSKLRNEIDVAGGALMMEAGLQPKGLTPEQRLKVIEDAIEKTGELQANYPKDKGLRKRIELLESAKEYVDATRRIDVTQQMFDKMKEKGYVPFGREGDYEMRVLNEDGSTAIYSLFETAKERRIALRNLKKAGFQLNKDNLELTKIEKPSSLLYQDLPASARITFKKMQDVVDGKLPPQGFDQHLIEANLVPGYSKNFQNQIAGYIVGVSNVAARSKYDAGIKRTLNEIKAKYENNGNPNPKYKEAYEHSQKLFDYVNSNQWEGQNLRKLMAFNNLGFNIKSAAVGMTQNVMTTLPEIQHIYNQAGVSVGKRGARAIRQWGRGHRQALEYLANPKRFAKNNPELAKVINEGYKDGTISDASAKAAYGFGERKRTGQTAKDFDNLVNFSMGLFRHADVYQRLHSTITMYNVKKDISPKASFEELQKFASDKTQFDTQFDYSRLNRPVIARGAVGAPFTTFKTFGANILRSYRRYWQSGSYDALLSSFAGLMALGGASALPFVSWIMRSLESGGINPEEEARNLIEKSSIDKIIQGLPFDGIDEEFAKKAEKQIGEVLLKGLPNLVGVDLSGSVAAGEQAPFLGKGALPTIANFVMGPTLKELERPGIFMSTLEKGKQPFGERAYRAFGEGLAPEFLKKIIRADVLAKNEGLFTNRYGDTIPDPDNPEQPLTLSPYEQFVTGVGFMPSRVGQAYNKYQSVRTLKESSQKPPFTARLASAIKKDEMEGGSFYEQQVLKDIDRWNEENPENQWNGRGSEINRALKKLEDPYYSGVRKQLPKAIRGKADEMMEARTFKDLKPSGKNY